MIAKQTYILTLVVASCFAQRSPYAGRRPIGYPEIEAPQDNLGDRFGEVDGTTQRLPLEALGDRQLINRLSKLPVDQQPFWFINWQALENNRQNPQTYPQKPNPFVDTHSNQGSFDNQGDFGNQANFAPNSNQGFSNRNPQLPNNNQGFVNNQFTNNRNQASSNAQAFASSSSSQNNRAPFTNQRAPVNENLGELTDRFSTGDDNNRKTGVIDSSIAGTVDALFNTYNPDEDTNLQSFNSSQQSSRIASNFVTERNEQIKNGQRVSANRSTVNTKPQNTRNVNVADVKDPYVSPQNNSIQRNPNTRNRTLFKN